MTLIAMDNLASDVATMLYETADALDALPPSDPESIAQHIEMIDAVETISWRAYRALPRAVLEKQVRHRAAGAGAAAQALLRMDWRNETAPSILDGTWTIPR
jgi:hypothetical protein